MEARATSRGWGGDVLIACLIAALMTFGWAISDWPMLSRLHLPDTDDVMRLQQIRDWLGGQPFTDLTQHRLGAPPGLPMHWSRLADLVPGAVIAVLTPHLGAFRAELVAVIAWPALLFATALALTAAIARRIDPQGEPRTAIILAAIGYPTTTIFLPGRIDHHGFQIVLLLALVRLLLARASVASGALAGIVSAASLVIGLETAPLLLVAAGILAVGWCRAQPGSTAQLTGYGLGLGFALGFGAIMFGGSGWRYPACDGFTATAWQVAQAGAFVPIILGLAGQRLAGTGRRVALLIGCGTIMAIILRPTLGACLRPYGAVDPLLARLWLANVGEAQPLFAADPATVIGYAGLMLAGIAATLWRCLRTTHPGWPMLLAFQLGAFALTCCQLRGAYAGAILSAPALAMTIGAARRHGTGLLVAAWLGSAGMLYPVAALAVAHLPGARPANTSDSAGGACATPEAMARLAVLPAATVIAPMDFGAYAIAATHHRLVAAPYHRNNMGNAAMYRFYLSTPAQAHRIARQWHARYVVFCSGQFGALGAQDRQSLDHALATGQRPDWLQPIDTGPSSLQLYAVRP